jgi:hypothetical protein
MNLSYETCFRPMKYKRQHMRSIRLYIGFEVLPRQCLWCPSFDHQLCHVSGKPFGFTGSRVTSSCHWVGKDFWTWRRLVYDEISTYCASCLFNIVCLLRIDIWGEVVAIRGRWSGVYEILLEATNKHVCVSVRAPLSGGCLDSLSVYFFECFCM